MLPQGELTFATVYIMPTAGRGPQTSTETHRTGPTRSYTDKIYTFFVAKGFDAKLS